MQSQFTPQPTDKKNKNVQFKDDLVEIHEINTYRLESQGD
jgi:hypothetical protein